jgi:fatty-acyl-CoA synthase
MRGLSMDHQLTIGAIARRAEAMSSTRAVVSKSPDGDTRRETWGAVIARARRLGTALAELGVAPGDRVASLCWNQAEHLDLYFGVPMIGAVLQTLNSRLGAEDLADIVTFAGSRVIVADASLAGLLEQIRATAEIDHAIVVGDAGGADFLAYEALLSAADPDSPQQYESDERDACTLCFTAGTTGRPKGVLYSHRSVALQALAAMASDFGGLSGDDVILVAVPMFHGNAWNQPYAAALAGSALVLPHSDLRAETLLRTIEEERVTVVGGAPAVWWDVLAALDGEPGRFDLSSLRMLRIGGARTPVELLRGLSERHGLPVVSGFGMIELGPTGGMAPGPRRLGSEQLDWAERCKTGYPIPFLEVRARVDEAVAPWDGTTVGELEYRGPSVASTYWDGGDAGAFTADGWLQSGDVGTIGPGGLIDIRDRSKDLIESGGEWISSQALEQALESHSEVDNAAVVGVPDGRWGERPLAVVVASKDAVTAELLTEHLRPHVPRWWLPERFEFVAELPRTEAGKVRKSDLRDRYSESITGGDRSMAPDTT